jgi:hypothetical protein
MLGVSLDPAACLVCLTWPMMPAWLDELRVENLPLGQARVDLLFRRHINDVALNVLREGRAGRYNVRRLSRYARRRRGRAAEPSQSWFVGGRLLVNGGGHRRAGIGVDKLQMAIQLVACARSPRQGSGRRRNGTVTARGSRTSPELTQ